MFDMARRLLFDLASPGATRAATGRLEVTMRMVNKIMLVGRIGRDPELRRPAGDNGTPWSVLSVATNRYRKEGEQWIEDTDWHQVKVFGKEAEYANRVFRKGSLVSVEGSLSYEHWTSEDGTKHHATRILADRVVHLHAAMQEAEASLPMRSAEATLEA